MCGFDESHKSSRAFVCKKTKEPAFFGRFFYPSLFCFFNVQLHASLRLVDESREIQSRVHKERARILPFNSVQRDGVVSVGIKSAQSDEHAVHPEYIKADEYVEVTPHSLRMRKVVLDELERKRLKRAAGIVDEDDE